MAWSPKIRLAAGCIILAACLAMVEAFARRIVTTTPARQALARYAPESNNHVVFLGSSLTDAAVRTDHLEGLLSSRWPGFRAFNLALAGLNGNENAYLLYKHFILPRSRPRYLVVEASGIPFLPSGAPFRLEGQGLRVESFRSEYIDYRDLWYLSDGFPGIASSLSYWLHKHWFSYHYRLEIQARLRERLFPTARADRRLSRPGNPYRMVDEAARRFTDMARKDLHRLESMPGRNEAMRQREAHFLDLATLARQNGATLVVLKPPLPPSDSLLAASPVFAEYQRAFTRLCDSLGVLYLDLSRKADYSQLYTYSDGIHLDSAGAREFTLCLAARLGEGMARKP